MDMRDKALFSLRKGSTEHSVKDLPSWKNLCTALKQTFQDWREERIRDKQDRDGVRELLIRSGTGLASSPTPETGCGSNPALAYSYQGEGPPSHLKCLGTQLPLPKENQAAHGKPDGPQEEEMTTALWDRAAASQPLPGSPCTQLPAQQLELGDALHVYKAWLKHRWSQMNWASWLDSPQAHHVGHKEEPPGRNFAAPRSEEEARGQGRRCHSVPPSVSAGRGSRGTAQPCPLQDPGHLQSVSAALPTEKPLFPKPEDTKNTRIPVTLAESTNFFFFNSGSTLGVCDTALETLRPIGPGIHCWPLRAWRRPT